ncbi:hypothetical protein [Ferrimonas balearica]|uniref:hypothetical protein n=1 Tax=Ferrimonas balearica TaxID=44012 RepID=UPI001F2CCDC7|nr:hypothetical protein [Ferrimonas balearica]MBY6095539.1 hypothetical protein [Ferrimonas balearica]
MNAKALPWMLLVASCSVAANKPDPAQSKVDLAMAEMGHVSVNESLFVLIEQGTQFETVQFHELLTTELHDLYLTRERAKALKLKKTRKFYVYGNHGIDALIRAIEQHVVADNPTYFSVDLLKDYHRQTGQFHYIARVIEY